MKTSFFALLLIGACFSQSQILMPEMNAEYSAPPGWTAGEKSIAGYQEYLISPTMGSKSVFLTVRKFNDSISIRAYMYQRLFNWVFQSAKDDSKISGSIPAIMDTTIGQIHFLGLESYGAKEVRVEYFKKSGLYLLSLWYRVSQADWEINRNEYYKNFQNLNFTNENAGLVKREVNSRSKNGDGSEIFFNLLGKRELSTGHLFQYKIGR